MKPQIILTSNVFTLNKYLEKEEAGDMSAYAQ